MSLFVCSLNSGSNGNCYYIGTTDEAVLIDAGLSRRETEKRMKRLGLSIKKVKAIFITHEHGDHIHGLPGILKKYRIPVYITPLTRSNSRLVFDDSLAVPFQANQMIKVGALSVTAIPKFHDAVEAHSFLISDGHVQVGVFTDVGRPCDHTIRGFEKCHAAFLESNYDIDLLEKGPYPLHLKNRIRDGLGHLSNLQALQLFVNHRPEFMTHLFPAHLSSENNSMRIVDALFQGVAGMTEVVIASRYKETPVFEINDKSGEKSAQKIEQLSLFQ